MPPSRGSSLLPGVMGMSGTLPPDSVDAMIAEAESKIIATTPGTVPPHLDDGGHLPFGGTLGGTRGPSLFGKRKIVTSDADPNPQALLLNFPPASFLAVEDPMPRIWAAIKRLFSHIFCRRHFSSMRAVARCERFLVSR